jgi:hypothetical protein
LNDLRVSGAAAKIALKTFPYLLVSGILILVEERFRVIRGS